jgi:hypothetical protein
MAGSPPVLPRAVGKREPAREPARHVVGPIRHTLGKARCFDTPGAYEVAAESFGEGVSARLAEASGLGRADRYGAGAGGNVGENCANDALVVLL